MQPQLSRTINTLITTALTMSAVFFLYSCNPKSGAVEEKNTTNVPAPVQKEITVYGSNTCDHCLEFMKKADSVALKYTFKDVETNAIYYSELVKKIKAANYQGYVSFPVIEIEGKINVNPPFAEFMKMIK